MGKKSFMHTTTIITVIALTIAGHSYAQTQKQTQTQKKPESKPKSTPTQVKIGTVTPFVPVTTETAPAPAPAETITPVNPKKRDPITYVIQPFVDASRDARQLTSRELNALTQNGSGLNQSTTPSAEVQAKSNKKNKTETQSDVETKQLKQQALLEIEKKNEEFLLDPFQSSLVEHLVVHIATQIRNQINFPDELLDQELSVVTDASQSITKTSTLRKVLESITEAKNILNTISDQNKAAWIQSASTIDSSLKEQMTLNDLKQFVDFYNTKVASTHTPAYPVLKLVITENSINITIQAELKITHTNRTMGSIQSTYTNATDPKILFQQPTKEFDLNILAASNQNSDQTANQTTDQIYIDYAWQVISEGRYKLNGIPIDGQQRLRYLMKSDPTKIWSNYSICETIQSAPFVRLDESIQSKIVDRVKCATLNQSAPNGVVTRGLKYFEKEYPKIALNLQYYIGFYGFDYVLIGVEFLPKNASETHQRINVYTYNLHQSYNNKKQAVFTLCNAKTDHYNRPLGNMWHAGGGGYYWDIKLKYSDAFGFDIVSLMVLGSSGSEFEVPLKALDVE